MSDPWGASAAGQNNGFDDGGGGGGENWTRRSTSPARRSRSPETRGRPQGGGADGGVNPGNNLHVSSLSSRVEDRDLEEAFGKFGKIKKAQIMRDPHSKESRGFAFVTMEAVEDADAAVAALNATELLGRTINVERARRARARTPTPGQYHGPPKRDLPGGGGGGYGRSYDSRGDGRRDDRRDYRDDRYDDRPPRRDYYDDRRGGGRDYDDRRGGGGGRDYDRRDRGGGGYDERSYGPPRDRYSDPRYDRRY